MAHAPITIASHHPRALHSQLACAGMIAFAQGVMIYILSSPSLVIPDELGGFGAYFRSGRKVFDAKVAANPNLAAGSTLALLRPVLYTTLAIGSAMALFMHLARADGLPGLKAEAPSASR